MAFSAPPVKSAVIPPYVAPGTAPGQLRVTAATPVGVRVAVRDRFCYVSTPNGDEIQLDQAGVFELTRACKAAFSLVTT